MIANMLRRRRRNRRPVIVAAPIIVEIGNGAVAISYEAGNHFIVRTRKDENGNTQTVIRRTLATVR